MSITPKLVLTTLPRRLRLHLTRCVRSIMV